MVNIFRYFFTENTNFIPDANWPKLPNVGNAATLEFDSQEGILYPIIVFPRNPARQGQFTIQVTDYSNLANDYCDQYQSLEYGDEKVLGSTVNATLQMRKEDVHYGIVGNRRRLRILTCFDKTTTAHNFLVHNGGCSSSALSGLTSLTDPSCAGNVNAAAPTVPDIPLLYSHAMPECRDSLPSKWWNT